MRHACMRADLKNKCATPHSHDLGLQVYDVMGDSIRVVKVSPLSIQQLPPFTRTGATV